MVGLLKKKSNQETELTISDETLLPEKCAQKVSIPHKKDTEKQEKYKVS